MWFLVLDPTHEEKDKTKQKNKQVFCFLRVYTTHDKYKVKFCRLFS